MTEYVEDHGLNEAVAKILSNKSFHEFDELRENNVKIMSRLKVTTNPEGEHKPCKGCPAKMQKVSDLHYSAGINATHILVMDYYAWNHPGGVDPIITMEAMLHKALKAIKAEKDEDGRVVFKKNEPEIVEFLDTARHYPPITEDQKEYKELLAAGAIAGAAAIATGTLEDPPTVQTGEPTDGPDSGKACLDGGRAFLVVRRKGRSNIKE